MQSPPLITAMSRLFALVGILAGLLLLAGARNAAAEEHEAPDITAAFANAPRQITIAWTHEEVGVYSYAIQLKLEGQWLDVQRLDHTYGQYTLADLEPETWYTLRVCADYDPDGAERECSEPEVSVQTQAAEQTPGQQRPPAPFIVSHEAGETWVRVCWLAGYDYASYFVNHHEEGAPLATVQTIDHENGGPQGCQRVDGLQPGRSYILAVQGCNETWFGIGSDGCYDWSAGYKVSTLRIANFIDQLAAPVITTTEAGDTWIAITWTTTPTTPRHNYDHFNIKYSVKPAPGEPPTPPTTDTEDGAQVSHTANNLQPSTTYVFSVQGCDLNLGLNGPPSVDCGGWGPEREATTNTPTPASGFLRPSIAAPPVAAAGSTIKVTGQFFPRTAASAGPGAVTLTLDGASLGTATVAAEGTFDADVVIPADTAAGNRTIRAVSGDASDSTGIEVTAAGGGGGATIILTAAFFGDRGCPMRPLPDYGQGITADEPFSVYGTGFTPGPVTLHLDSATGMALGTATVQADGTFCHDAFQGPPASQVGANHTLVAVQDGMVKASIPVFVDRLDVVR